MAGLFDDLVPQGAQPAGGLFDDLVPAQPAPEAEPAGLVDNLTRFPRAAVVGLDRAGRAIGGLGLDIADMVVRPVARAVGDEEGYDAAYQDFRQSFDPKRESVVPLGVNGQPTITDNFAAGGAQAGAALATGVGVLGAGRQALGAFAPYAAGALGDFLAFDGQSPNLSSVVQDATGMPLATAIQPGDSEVVGRLKNVGEGGVLGGVADAVLRGAGRMIRGPEAPPPRPQTASAEEIAAMNRPEPYVPPGGEDTRRVLEASGILPPQVGPAGVVPRVADELAYERAVERVEGRRGVEAVREQPLVTNADVAAQEAEAAKLALARQQAIDQAPRELTAEQLAEARAAGEQPAPRPAPDVIEVQPALSRAEVRNDRAGSAAPEARQALAGEADAGAQAAMQRVRADQAGTERAFDLADIQARRGEEYAAGRQAAEYRFAADEHYDSLTRRIGEDPAALVQRQLSVPPEQFRAMPADARERVVQAAQRQTVAERPGPTMATTDAALSGGEARYSPSSRPQDAAGPAGAGRQPTDIELDITGADRSYTRTATGAGDRPFRTEDSSGLDFGARAPEGGLMDERAAAFEARATEQTAQARAASEDELLRRWQERASARTSDGRGPDFDARNQYEGKKAQGTFTNRPGKADAEGRYATDDFGFVRSDKGGPIRFADQRQAAKWILNEGHKKSPDQVFEIENHPAGKGFTVRERGRSAPQQGAQPAGSAPEGATVAPARALSPPMAPEPSAAPRSEPEPRVSTDAPAARTDSFSVPQADASGRIGDEPAEGAKITSGIDPADVWQHLGKPALELVKRELSAAGKDVANLRRVLRSGTADARPVAGASNAVNYLVSSNRGVMHLLRNRYERAGNADGARLLSDLSDALGTDPGSGRAVKQTYEEAVNQHAFGMTNRMGNMVGRDRLGDEKLAQEVGDILAGRSKVGSTEARQAADRIRGLLNETHRYLQTAGVDVGYRADYFPRALDGDKVRADQAGFLKDAEAMYRKIGLSPDEARQAANDWYDRELGIGSARFAPQGPLSNLTKGRVLPPEADKLMADWYNRNAFDVLSTYFRNASRMAEFTRRFGKGGEKLDAMYDGMLKAGVHPDDVALMRRAADSSLGLLNGGSHTNLSSAVSWVQTIGILRALPRAVWSSLAEPFAIGVRTGNALDGLKAFGDTWKQVFGSGSLQDQRDVAEFIGTVGDAMTNMMLQGQFGGGVAGKVQNMMLARFFQRSGLEPLTQAQRVAGLRIGQDYIARLLRDAEGGSRQQSAKELLADLGIAEADMPGVKRLLDGAGGMPKVADLMGGSPEAQTYTAALNRFVDESIQNPKAVDRPALANHPVGRLAYGIMSFMYAYTRNVTYRLAKQGARAVTPGNGLTMADRAALTVGPGIALALLSSMQIGVARVRDSLTNTDESKARPQELSAIQYISRSGGFGNLDPLVNSVLGAKYERDLTGIVAGPYVGQYLQDAQKLVGLLPEPIGKNSPNTNSAEWNAARAAYNMVATPAIAAALAMAPGGPVLSKGYGALIASPLGGVGGPALAPLSPQTSSDFATAVAGERPPRWQTQPSGRQEAGRRSSQSSRPTGRN